MVLNSLNKKGRIMEAGYKVLLDFGSLNDT
jgi:hypothetical protein